MSEDIQDFIKRQFPYGWVPQDGPQQEAYLSKAKILLYGGAAGGGKSDLLCGTALQGHHRAVIFRAQYVDIAGKDGIAGRLLAIIGSQKGYNGQKMEWVCPEDKEKIITLGALMKPDAENAYQGRAKDFIGFDEGAQLTEDRVRYVMGWLRTTKAGQRARVIIASNPPKNKFEGQWLLEWFGPWINPAHPRYPTPTGKLLWGARAPNDRLVWFDSEDPIVMLNHDGYEWRYATADEITLMDNVTKLDKNTKGAIRPESYTFIPAKVTDNKYLNANEYIAGLQGLNKDLRDRLLYGDFMASAEDSENQVVPSAWIDEAVDRWNRIRGPQYRAPAQIVSSLDVAEGGKDNCCRVSIRADGTADHPQTRPGVETPDGPSAVGWFLQGVENNQLITVDCTGGWGGSSRDILRAQSWNVIPFVASKGTPEQSADGLYEFANERTKAIWRLRESLNPQTKDKIRLSIPMSHELIQEIVAHTFEIKNKNVISICSKDEVKARIGRSPDNFDALVMANVLKDKGVAYITSQSGRGHNATSTVPIRDPYDEY